MKRLVGEAREFMRHVNAARKRHESVAYVPDATYWMVIATAPDLGKNQFVAVGNGLVSQGITVLPESRRR